jgi:orotidine-5'-phosphate decarboxylase
VDAARRLIVALDVPERRTALALASALRDEVAMVKVGLEGFTAHGLAFVGDIAALGVPVFLDLKLHDIPRTAAAAARAIASSGARLVTVHASGGPDMIRAVRDVLPQAVDVIAVTVLTSLDRASLGRLGLGGSVAALARRLGRAALESGAQGLVCSSYELTHLASLGGTRVVPGIRPPGAYAGDQKRVATPLQAVRAGATWIVVGRPVTTAADPVAAARAINEQIGGVSG